jgi:folate-binding protein YgfZ
MREHDNRSVPYGPATAIVVRSDRTGDIGFDIYIDAEMRDGLRSALLNAGATAVGRETLETLRIEGGRPEFGVDMDEETIPLEAGIEDTAISLTKGCYVGQEVIIRVLHRGHGRVARRLVGLLLESNAGERLVPTAGARILAGGKETGSITSATYSPRRGSPIALGYVQRDFVDPGTKLEVEAGDRRVGATVVDRPFVRSESRGSLG